MSDQNLSTRTSAGTAQQTQPFAALHPSAKAFKVVAIAEAFSWAGLLVGMFFKWIVQSTELGVRIFGPIHGGIFVAYVVSCFWAASVHKWSVKHLVLGLVSSIPPFMTVWFERFAERHGLLAPAAARRTRA